MTEKRTPDAKGLRLYPRPPKNFDPFTATKKDLMRFGLPLRPDPHTQPGLAALWERLAARYRGFDHLELRPGTTKVVRKPVRVPYLGPDPSESCGYQLTSSAPFTALFVTWTVPDLWFSTSPTGPNHFHTYVGLGLIDVHVEMTVDPTENVTCQMTVSGVPVNLPVRPGDVISASLCLETDGIEHYFLANETTFQTINFTGDTGLPPAVTINAGVTRGNFTLPIDPLAQFGVVYFDEISAYTTSGARSLTSGDAMTMVDQNGETLARPVRLTDFAFKTVFVAA